MTDNSVGPEGGSRDLLRIEVIDNEIVVSLPESQLSVTYYKSDKSPQLLAKRITEKYDPRTPMTVSEFLAKAGNSPTTRRQNSVGSNDGGPANG